MYIRTANGKQFDEEHAVGGAGDAQGIFFVPSSSLLMLSRFFILSPYPWSCLEFTSTDIHLRSPDVSDEAYFASSVHKGASVTSFLWRCLPSRNGAQRSFFWVAFMWLLEIPEHLENNIYRKVKKLIEKKRLPRPNEVPGIAQQYLFTPYVPVMKWGKEYVKHKVSSIYNERRANYA